jgi:carboxypeptidase T
MDLHSYAEIIIWPWGFTGPDPGNLDQLTTLGRKLAYFNGYDPSHSIWYDVDGDTIDFAYGDAGVASFVFELGTSFFQDCGTFLDEILPDNLESLIYARRWRARRTSHPPAPRSWT